MRITQRPLFYWILRRQRPLQGLLLLVILASLFFRVFPLEMQKRIINEAIHLKDEQLLFIYCGLYMGAVVLAAVSKYAINVMQTVIGQKILVEMRSELYRHLLQLPLQFYRTVPPGTVISAMTAELNGIGFFLGGALAIPVTSVLTFLVFLGFMFSLSPLLALLSIVIYPLEMIVIPLLQKRYNRLNKKRIKTTRAMSNVVNESVSGLQEIHANASYQLEEKRMAAFIETLYNILKRLFIVKYGIKFANNMFQSFGPFILFLVGGYLTINGQFTLGALVAFLSAYEKVYDPWKEMMEYYQALQNAQVLYRQIMSTFDLQPRHPLLPDGREPYRLQGRI
ncbi:MAG TPA: ABC transporter ATP-binding protein, partial [Desulfobacteraceae bacterium]|nr:ABC transporter ATP-binding protein [Desulfobacteraceae bacterium]